MGIKGSPPYFQRVMATQVLDGIIHTICQLYIDDCIVFASTEDEYMTRLEQVFQRFADRNIILNPDNTKLGLDEVEYVGHLISVEGIKFTEEKLANALSFPKPVKEKELKQFIGLVNYFRNHLRNLSSVMAPLQDMLLGYQANSSKLLRWTPQTESAYDEVMGLLRNCPMLFFMDNTSPIHLYTDASEEATEATFVR